MSKTGYFFWALTGGLTFALLGGVFGALAGWSNGRTSGTFYASSILRTLERICDCSWTPAQRSTLAGAIDGALFLGVVGICIGLGAAYSQIDPASWFVPAFLLLFFLVLGALFFGMLARGLVVLRTGSLAGVFVGGLGGALATAHWVGPEHIVPGAVGGLVLGTLLGLLLSRARRNEE